MAIRKRRVKHRSSDLQKRLEAGGMTVIFVKPIPYGSSPSAKRAHDLAVKRAVAAAIKGK